MPQRPWRLRAAAAATLTLAAGIALAAGDKKIADDPAAAFRQQVHQDVMNVRNAHNLTPASVSDEQIVAAMKRAIDYLLKEKHKDNWESVDSWSRDESEGAMKGGETALVLLALLEAGQSLDDPRLRFRSPELAPVVDYITKLQSDKTYVLGLQACALSLLPQANDQKFRAALTKIKDQLVSAAEQNGAYGYSVKKENNQPPMVEEAAFTIPYRGKKIAPKWKWDNSNSQYALLGVWSAADAGLPVPAEYWSLQDALWRATQCKNGAWCYDAAINGPAKAQYYGTDETSTTEFPATTFQRPTITAAALASLYIMQSYLDTEVRLEPKPDPVLVNGLKNFTETLDPCFADGYYLYGIERVALASGYKYFGKVDWYRDIACTLLATQQDAGAWQYHMNVGTSPNVGAAYGLLVLARGRNPILFNKLEYDGPWNARPRDDANLTHWMSKTFERPLNWQIVNIAMADDEWRDAPILLITGSKDPKFSPEQLAKLKSYIDGGGLIFSSADGGAEAFTSAMKKYAAEIVNHVYEGRNLPKDHPIFTLYFDEKVAPPMWGLSNGSRELWIHSSTDMGASWQKQAATANKASFEIPANIFFYASGKGKLHPRLQAMTPAGGEQKQKVTVGRLQYSGNWDPEPGAWPRFATLAKADWSTGVNLVTVKPEALDPAKTPFVHLTGTAKFTLPPEQLAAIKTFVQKGGTLCFDACGGSPAFTDSAKDAIKDLDLGKLERIADQDPLFAGSGPATAPIKDYGYRGPVILRLNGKPQGSRLQIVRVGQHGAVLLSEEDMISGLLGSHTWIAGYEPDTATALLRNMVMESSLQK